jgi:hypothetical protein
MRDPVDKTQAALAEARHLLGILHERKFLKPGRERRVVTEGERDSIDARLRFKFNSADIKLPFVRPWEEVADAVAGAFTRGERVYLLRLLNEDATKRPPRRGRPDNGSRDFWIAQAVARLVETHELTPTRNREPDPHCQPPASACAIVARVLAELGVELSETGVETIWSRRRAQDFWWDQRLQPPERVRQKSPDF